MTFNVVDASNAAQLQKTADNLLDNINNKYPSNTLGIQRILPWNWGEKPKIPEEMEEGYKLIKSLSKEKSSVYKISKQEILKNTVDVLSLNDRQLLLDGIDSINYQINPTSNYIVTEEFDIIKILFFVVFLVSMGRGTTIRFRYFSKNLSKDKKRTFKNTPRFNSISLYSSILPVSIFVFCTSSRMSMIFILTYIPMLIILFSFIISSIEWPKNPCLKNVSHYIPYLNKLALFEF